PTGPAVSATYPRGCTGRFSKTDSTTAPVLNLRVVVDAGGYRLTRRQRQHRRGHQNPRRCPRPERYCFTNHIFAVGSVFRKLSSIVATFSRPESEGCVRSVGTTSS